MHEFTSLIKFLLIFGSMILICGFAYSLLTRWSALSGRYKYVSTENQISEGSFRWVSCKMSMTPLSVAIEIYSRGLWLKPGIPLAIMMPAVLIPWEKLKLVHSNNSFLGKRTNLEIEGYGIIRLNGAAGTAVERKLTHFTG